MLRSNVGVSKLCQMCFKGSIVVVACSDGPWKSLTMDHSITGYDSPAVWTQLYEVFKKFVLFSN